MHLLAQGLSAARQSDQFTLAEVTNAGLSNALGRTLVAAALDSGPRNCIILIAGQSNTANNVPSLYAPSNGPKVQNFSVYDGGVYVAKDPLLGCSWISNNSLGSGNFAGRLADKLINAGKFDRVILVPIGINGTSIAQWAPGGPLANRFDVAYKRLQAAGLPVSAILWGQGENDSNIGTTQTAYQNGLSSLIAYVRELGFTAPWFVATQTLNGGSTSAAIQAAQAAVVNHAAGIWAGANADSLTGSNRQPDNTHFTDAGADAYAGLWQAALAAYGPPF